MNQLANAFKKFPSFLSFESDKSAVSGGGDKDASKDSPPATQAHTESEQPLMHNTTEAPKRHRQIPRVEGFVDVGTTPDKKNLAFSGLLLPGTDRESKLRNRFIFLDYHTDQWFIDLCWEIVNGTRAKMPLRVRVSAMVGENRAYVKPCTHNERQVMHEWGRLQEEIRGYAQDIGECRTVSDTCEFVYRRVAEQKNLKIVKWVNEDFTALAVNKSGIIFRMSGANEIDRWTGGILSGHVDLDEEIEKNVTVYRAYRI